ncbi:hypothetical protein SprV_0401410200 [Sparganum proliferum]
MLARGDSQVSRELLPSLLPGLISYYSAFLPSLHDVRGRLNRLLQKDAPWCWSADCEKAFTQLKSMLSSNQLLTHYDPTLPIVVAADASNHGVGAVISDTFPDGSEKAIMHASRTLTPAKKNYGQIEKEVLALVFVVKKFQKLLHGRHFTLLTDHKPLLSIFGLKKGIPVYSASRLRRWATILLGYDFDIPPTVALQTLVRLTSFLASSAIIGNLRKTP